MILKGRGRNARSQFDYCFIGIMLQLVYNCMKAMEDMEVEGIVASRMRGKEREFLVKWRDLPEPLWQPHSNQALQQHFDHYFEMMNCTFDYFPTVLRIPKNRVKVHLRGAEMTVFIRGKKVSDERNLVLSELEAICHNSIKKQQK